jgi:hypothetical protein
MRLFFVSADYFWCRLVKTVGTINKSSFLMSVETKIVFLLVLHNARNNTSQHLLWPECINQRGIIKKDIELPERILL